MWRADSLEKTLMLGKIGGRRRGRQRMRWLDGRFNGHGFGWTLGVGEAQGGLAGCGSWGHKESDTTERLNWTELKANVTKGGYTMKPNPQVNMHQGQHFGLLLGQKQTVQRIKLWAVDRKADSAPTASHVVSGGILEYRHSDSPHRQRESRRAAIKTQGNNYAVWWVGSIRLMFRFQTLKFFLLSTVTVSP